MTEPQPFCAVCWTLTDDGPCRYEHWEDAVRRKPIAHHFVEEMVSHSDRIVIVIPEAAVVKEWKRDDRSFVLTQGPWTAVVTPCRLVESEGYISHNTTEPETNAWKAEVGGYMISNRPVISRGGGCSKTYIIYLDSLDFAQRCAQRALALWGPEWNARRERERADAIDRLAAHNQALQGEIERLYMRLQGAYERLDEIRAVSERTLVQVKREVT